MPLLTAVESRSVRGRLLQAGVVLALTLGGITMVYPFAVMVSGSLQSEVDQAQAGLVPRFLFDPADLYRKFLETKHNFDLSAYDRARELRVFSFAALDPPTMDRPGAAEAAARAAALLRADTTPAHWLAPGGVAGVGTSPLPLRSMRRAVAQRFGHDPAAYTAATGTPLESWLDLTIQPPRWFAQQYDVPAEPMGEAMLDVIRHSDPAWLSPVSLTGYFLEARVWPSVGADPYAIADALGITLAEAARFQLPPTVPPESTPALRAAWVTFVREDLHPSFIEPAAADAEARYRAAVRAAYRDDLGALRNARGDDTLTFDTIALPRGRWVSGVERLDYQRFLDTLTPDELRLTGPEFTWRAAQPPGATDSLQDAVAVLEYQHVRDHAASLRWRFATRNYIVVWQELALEGRALLNTVTLCALAIVVALLVNPLAAYALSRFRLPGGYKLLLIFMATTAFPPIVTLIPQFVILRNAGLMNTVVALLLPLAANGYLIFLLKGFFDSIPGELYEAATIDGAGEVRIFFQIAMSLSKPILAVLALQTFTAAYTMFLYALLVAPDPDQWLISVWLFQFQQRSGAGGVYASVLIASVPTLVIFLLVQRTIMRGIVVPTEK